MIKVYPENELENPPNQLEKLDTTIKSLNIQKLKCSYFIPQKDNDQLCACFKEFKYHNQQVQDEYKNKTKAKIDKWNMNDCTSEDGETDAYGDLKFNNSNQSISKFIRVSGKTSKATMINLFKQCWNLKRPDLVISVTGGAKLNLKLRLKETFCRSLEKVATTTNAWVTTGGTNNGCMKLVGEAFRLNSMSVDPDKLVPLLGIANWCTVENHEFLKNKLGEEIEYELIKNTNSKKSKSALLDPNHSHFVLVDNAFYNFGSEIDFRTELEAEIARFYQIPIVVLVIGGGWRTVSTMLESLKKKTPCVILESSGECANVLTYALNKWDKYQEKSRKETEVLSESELILKYTEDLKKEIEESYPNQKKDIVDLVIKFIFEMLKPENRKYLTVCKPINDKAEIDVAILNARIELDQTNQEKKMLPIDMALNWNRIDIARSKNLLESVKDDNNKLNDLMYQAILNDRVEFVKLLIENNFPFKNFASWKMILQLYKNIPADSLLNKLVNKRHRKGLITVKNIGNTIEFLVDDFYQHKFSTNPYKRLSFEESVPNTNDFEIDKKFENPEHELFIYSILLCRFEMAKLFCLKGKDSISSALLATKILKKYGKEFEDFFDECNEMAGKFEQLACDLLQLCFDKNESYAELTLIRKIAEINSCTCMQLAVVADDKNFIAHPCFQNVLNRIWFYKILPDNPKINIMISIIFPFLSPFLIRFRSNEQNQKSLALDRNQSQSTELVESQVYKNANEPSQFYDEGNNDPKNKLKFFWSFIKTPFVKFFYNQVMYLLFLILFSYVILCDFHKISEPNKESSLNVKISIPEVVLIIWIFTFALDELRRFKNNERMLLKSKIKDFLFDFWNALDIAALLGFVIGLILRFIDDDECFVAAKIIWSLDVILWFFKCLQSYIFLENLGPKLFMIGKMCVQLVYFLLIVLIFMFAFGISTQSLMYSNQALDKNLLANVFFPAYFFIGGEYYTRDLIMKASVNQCVQEDLGNGQKCPDEVGAGISLALYVIYLIFLNILLVNLLIAIFNNVYESIEADSKKIWKLQRYGLVFEYYNKPFLPPPFVLFSFIIYLFKTLIRFIVERKNVPFLRKFYSPSNSYFVYNFDNAPKKEKNIIDCEASVSEDYVFNEEINLKEAYSYKLEQNSNKLDHLLSKLDELLDSMSEDMNQKIDNLNKNVDVLLNKNQK